MSDEFRSGKERDLVLAPNEYAYVSDQTKGNIDVYVGPHKASLSQTDQPVVFDDRTKQFKDVMLNEAIQLFAVTPEGWYSALKNPAAENKNPTSGASSSVPELSVGHKINIPGPTSFALWPGQMIRLLKGHHLRSNQYLVARVYDSDIAQRDADKAIVVKKDGEDTEETPVETSDKYIMGQLLIIKGINVSFYIPPSGVEVVMEQGSYVRDAVTLERLEYCVLLDENGNKRFVEGPDVVFPEPTEDFLTGSSGTRKFKAIDLNEISGLYIKVIADYTEDIGEKSMKYKVGDELFITGKDQMVYFPREEHAIIKYGEQDIHYAVAIPKGEARYVMRRLSGEIRLEKGPKMFLADPRGDINVRRILDPKDAAIWFPGSEDAVAYNEALLETQRESQPDSSQMYMSDDIFASEKTRSRMSKKLSAYYDSPDRSIKSFAATAGMTRERPDDGQMADQVQRKKSFTPPRSIILDTKYEGAIPIDVWTGYAVLVVGKSGQREVVVGPKRRILEYDEILEAITLSAGKPKGSKPQKKTVYLRVLHNKVSDIVHVETKDLVSAEINLSYRVNFEGKSEKWFDVEDYIKFLTDHLRSLLKGIVKQIGIEDFYADYTSIIRDAVLGKAVEGGERKGRSFSENGMRIYDIDIRNVKIGDSAVEHMLINNQTEVVEQGLRLKSEKRKRDLTKEINKINREISDSNQETVLKNIALDLEEVKKKDESSLEDHKILLTRKKEETLITKEIEKNLDVSAAADLIREKSEQEQNLDFAGKELIDKIKWLEAEVSAAKEKGEAYSPQLITALNGIVELGMAETIADGVSIPALLGGKDVVDIFQKLFGNIPIIKEGLSRLKSSQIE